MMTTCLDCARSRRYVSWPIFNRDCRGCEKRMLPMEPKPEPIEPEPPHKDRYL